MQTSRKYSSLEIAGIYLFYLEKPPAVGIFLVRTKQSPPYWDNNVFMSSVVWPMLTAIKYEPTGCVSVCICERIVAIIALRFWQLGQDEGLENTGFIFMRFFICKRCLVFCYQKKLVIWGLYAEERFSSCMLKSLKNIQITNIWVYLPFKSNSSKKIIYYSTLVGQVYSIT